MTGFDETVESTYPGIKWREAIPVFISGRKYVGCRLCIAHYGLKGREVGKAVAEGVLHPDRDSWQKHMEKMHSLGGDGVEQG